MNIERSTIVTLSAGDIIRALRQTPGCPLDIQAMPLTGSGVGIDAVGRTGVRLTYIRGGDKE